MAIVLYKAIDNTWLNTVPIESFVLTNFQLNNQSSQFTTQTITKTMSNHNLILTFKLQGYQMHILDSYGIYIYEMILFLVTVLNFIKFLFYDL